MGAPGSISSSLLSPVCFCKGVTAKISGARLFAISYEFFRPCLQFFFSCTCIQAPDFPQIGSFAGIRQFCIRTSHRAAAGRCEWYAMLQALPKDISDFLLCQHFVSTFHNKSLHQPPLLILKLLFFSLSVKSETIIIAHTYTILIFIVEAYLFSC